jgi:hypothetical protein
MKEKLSTPIAIGVIVAVLIGAVYFIFRMAGSGENADIDMKAIEKKQMEYQKKMKSGNPNGYGGAQ